MTALWPLGYTTQQRRDDIASGEAAARSAPQLGTRKGDLGSWPQERIRLLQGFIINCSKWYEWRQDPCYATRRAVYNALVHRHGANAVLRWQPAIKAVLDRAEAEVRSVHLA